MGKTKTYQNGEGSSNIDINDIIPKPETLQFDLPSDVVYSRQFGDNVASSSRSNVKVFLTGMGFSPSLVDKVIEENGEDNVDLLLEILMECSDDQKSNSETPDSVDNLFDEKDARNHVDQSIFIVPKEEPDMFDAYDEKRESLLKMNFTVEEVDFAMEKLGMHAPVDEIVDFITASQLAAKYDEEPYDEPEVDSKKTKTEEDISNDVLFGAMAKTLDLFELGFSESEISLAIDRFGTDVPVIELANAICAEQAGEEYFVKRQPSKHFGVGPSGFSGSVNAGTETKLEFPLSGIELKPEDLSQEVLPPTRNPIMEELYRGKRPKEEDGEDYDPSATLLEHIGLKKKDKGKRPRQAELSSSFDPTCVEEKVDPEATLYKGKRPRQEYTAELRSSFDPTFVEEKVDPEATLFGIPKAPKSKSSKGVDRLVAKPPYFFYGNVATVSFSTWTKISQFLYGIEAEFVDTRFFSALSRKEGYVHNLPTENRSYIHPKPPMSIEEAVPHTKKWWPSWDTRTKLSDISCVTNGIPQLCDKLKEIITDARGVLSSDQKREILYYCEKYSLIWVGPRKLGPLDPEYLEIILGYPLNHAQTSGTTLSERLHMLKHSFQIDALAYQLSVLKSMYPEGITMLSLFTGIGGAELALHRLGIHMKGVVSVEHCETKRKMLKTWWSTSGQTGKLEQVEDIQKLTSSKISRFIEMLGGFDFIICESSCTAASQNAKMGADENKDQSAFDFTLFCEFVRVLQRVRGLMERKR
ncbi:probable inactive DNA (cytosine-5)-methyltransferase DRM3 isoform X2 [Euphorbia lathyris]|uniref:probable inactive DNA (cytosine-5)-methyltransferase DRM3 isoform X2 n=1 Tax=Euphorbia lathyris TaxID=212925 RepID=UPI0033133589